MTLSDLSIRRPVFAWMLMFGLIVFGSISLNRMGVSQMPAVDFPILSIRATWEGAAPEVMESEIVDKIEQAVIAVDGLKDMRSTIRQGSATVELEFDLARNIDAALQEVQGALAEVRLPLNVDPPVIRKSSTDSEPIIRLGVTGKLSPRELVDYVETFLRDQFQVIPGVGEVEVHGFGDRNLRLWVNNTKLKEYELTILDVQQAIDQEHSEQASGYIENDKQEMNLRTMGEGLSADDVGNILINRRGGQPIYESTIHIHDVAQVEDGLSDVRHFVRLSGVPGVGISINKQRGANEVEVGRLVKARVEELQKSLPEGMKLYVNIDFTQFVEEYVQATKDELITSAVFTALICLLFLGSLSSGFNIMLAIPTSIVGTFTILFFSGFTLNTFTLLGLALAIGIVVDDAIMVLENIVRHFEMGKDRVQASTDGAREITFAAVATTAAVVAIFLPVAFMEGVIGRFFFQFGVTITAAVSLSLLEAITLTPMRLSQMMAHKSKPGLMTRQANAVFGSLIRVYGIVLRYVLRHRGMVLITATVLFALSLWIGSKLPQELVPPMDQSFIRMSAQAPVGSSLALTDSRMKEVEKYIAARPEVEKYFMMIGGGSPNQGFAGVALVQPDKRKKSQAQLMKEFRKDLSEIKGLRLSFQDMSSRTLGARRSQAVEFSLRGSDYGRLDKLSREIMTRLEKTGLVVDLDSNYRAGMPEVRIVADRAASAARGVSMDEIGRTVNAAIGGVRQGSFTRDGRRYDIRLRLAKEDRIAPEDVKKLTVRTAYGEIVPLGDVVKLETVSTLQSITRVNRQRAISVSANLAPGASQSVALTECERIAREVLPPGYSFYFEGGAKTFRESFGNLWFAFLLGIVVAYMVLASQFNSFIHPFTILLALPFSITGALVTLWIAGISLNLFSAIGIILLMGIVKKNSILLVEFINRKRAEGMDLTEAILAAAPVRLRPILMTSVSTIAAAVPIALGLGPGAETRRPMALAVIGGMIVSTLFTLVVVPCAYALVARVRRPAR